MEEVSLVVGSSFNCVKCDQPAQYSGNDLKRTYYCKECFLQMVRNKFRTALSKRKVFRDADSRKALIVYDGMSSASFLLNQVGEALRQVHFKRLMIEPTILVLVSVSSSEEINKVIEKVDKLKLLLPENINWAIAHVASYLLDDFRPSLSDFPGNCYGTEKVDQLDEMLSSCNSTTYRTELLRIFKELCLKRIANELGLNKIMLPDDSDDLGRLALSQLCLGRGGAVSNLTGVLDKRKNVVFVRPIREISKAEIGIFNHLSGFDNDCVHLEHEKIFKNSVQSLTDGFVGTLFNEGFKSTITTVLSTTGKIHGAEEGNTTDRCRFCDIELVPNGDLLCPTCIALNDSCNFDILKLCPS